MSWFSVHTVCPQALSLNNRKRFRKLGVCMFVCVAGNDNEVKRTYLQSYSTENLVSSTSVVVSVPP